MGRPSMNRAMHTRRAFGVLCTCVLVLVLVLVTLTLTDILVGYVKDKERARSMLPLPKEIKDPRLYNAVRSLPI